MQMIPVTSSHITAIGYDAASSTLAVAFAGGQMYHYADVSETEYAGLMQASSKGSYLRRYVIPRYASTKQETPMATTPHDLTITIADAKPVREILAALSDMLREMHRGNDHRYDAHVERIRTAAHALPEQTFAREPEHIIFHGAVAHALPTADAPDNA